MSIHLKIRSRQRVCCPHNHLRAGWCRRAPGPGALLLKGAETSLKSSAREHAIHFQIACWTCNLHNCNFETCTLQNGHAIWKKIACSTCNISWMHVEHAIMNHQLSDMGSEILTWRCGFMWTCILLSDMQFDSVPFSFFWLIMTIFFHTPTPLFDSSSYISRQIKKKTITHMCGFRSRDLQITM